MEHFEYGDFWVPNFGKISQNAQRRGLVDYPVLQHSRVSEFGSPKWLDRVHIQNASRFLSCFHVVSIFLQSSYQISRAKHYTEVNFSVAISSIS